MALLKLSILIFAFGCCCLVSAQDDPKSGMGCKTEKGFEYCEGKSPSYSDAAKDAESGSDNTQLLTRGHGPAGGSGPAYGFNPPALCDRDDQDHCQQLNVLVAPTLLKNSNNQQRYILQNKNIEQKIKLAICSDSKCGRGGTCDQQYATVQLLAWDPKFRHPKLVVENFRIPSCCKCGRKGFPGPPH